MRSLSATLLAEQKKTTTTAYVKVTFTGGLDSHIYSTPRILSLSHSEEPYRQSAELLLDNSDGELTTLDLKGFKAVISYGYVTSAGEEFSASPPLYVVHHELFSAEGKLTCELKMIGIPNLLAYDRANTTYIPTNADTKTVKTLIREVAGDTGATILPCYSHCQPYDVLFLSEDDLIDTYQPKDAFRIYVNGSRLAAIRRLLDFTKCIMRIGANGTLEILKPTISTTTAWAANTGYSLGDNVIPTTANDYQYKCTTAGTSGASEPTWTTGIGDTITDGTVVWTVAYDYEYSLETGHTFFSKAYRKTLVLPNYIVIMSNPDDDPQYSGFAQDAESIAAFQEVRQYRRTRLASNAQAAAIAEANLSKYQLNAEMGSADVPVNCGAELFDFVKVTDKRQNDFRIGNIGSLTRLYKPPKYTMRFSFGGWLTVAGLFSNLEVYPSDVKPSDVEEVWLKNIVEDTTPELGGNLDALTHLIKNLGAPVDANDAARKTEVDTVEAKLDDVAVSSPSRSFATIYHNTSGKIMTAVSEVIILLYGDSTTIYSAGTIVAEIGSSSPPETSVARVQINVRDIAVSGGNNYIQVKHCLVFIVPPGYYYRLRTIPYAPVGSVVFSLQNFTEYLFH